MRCLLEGVIIIQRGKRASQLSLPNAGEASADLLAATPMGLQWTTIDFRNWEGPEESPDPTSHALQETLYNFSDTCFNTTYRVQGSPLHSWTKPEAFKDLVCFVFRVFVFF